MKKEITITAAYDKRNPSPNKNYGIHGCNLRFIYGDERGYVQFLLFTNWQLPHVTEELKNRPYEAIGGDLHWMERPQPADLGFHSPTPQYAGQDKMESCDLLENGCYYDGSGLNAERIYNVMRAEGSEGVWKELETYWNELFAKTV